MAEIRNWQSINKEKIKKLLLNYEIFIWQGRKTSEALIKKKWKNFCLVTKLLYSKAEKLAKH